MKSAEPQVAVIGAGVAGLSAAVQLARQGVGVTVLEAAPEVGGCCGTTELAGYRFNDGAQFIMLPQLVRLVLQHLGIDSARLALQRARTPLHSELADGTRVNLHPDLRVEVLAGSIEADKARGELERMLARWQPLLDSLAGDDWLLQPIRSLDVARRLGRHLPLFSRPLQDELNSAFSDPTFRAVMAGHLLFAGAPARRFRSPSILALVSVLADGLYVPEGGMGKLPQVLAQAVREQGGRIITGASVQRIVASPRGGLMLATNALQPIEFRSVISTISPFTTLGTLLESAALPQGWRRRLSRPRLSMKTFAVQLGLRRAVHSLSHLNHMLPRPAGLEAYFSPTPDKVEWVYASVPSLVVADIAPPGGSLVELYPAIPQAPPASAWDEAGRERLAEAAIAWLRAREPIDIAVSRVRSPRDFERQLGLTDGGIYGVDPAAGFTALFPQRTPIPGLYLAGQSCFPGFGVPMAAVSGIRAARLVMDDLAGG